MRTALTVLTLLGICVALVKLARFYQQQVQQSRLDTLRALIEAECPKGLTITPPVYRWTHPDEKVKPTVSLFERRKKAS